MFFGFEGAGSGRLFCLEVFFRASVFGFFELSVMGGGEG